MGKPKTYPPNPLLPESDGVLAFLPHEAQDLERQFELLPETGEHLACWPNDQVRWPRYIRTGDNAGGSDNHFQGAQRLRGGTHLVISGSDPAEPMSHLFVARMASRPADARWGSNLNGKSPPAEDCLVKTVGLDDRLWHPGGMAVLGDVLAVPLENAKLKCSEVRFLDFRDPENPAALPGWTIGRPEAQAAAVALTLLPDQRLLVGAWTASDPSPRVKKHLDLYVSTDRDPLRPTFTLAETLVSEVAHLPSFQTLSFVWHLPADKVADGRRLYLVGFENTSPAAPDFSGKDRALLYRVDLSSKLGGPASQATTALPAVDEEVFRCRDSYCNMDAGTGIFIGADGKLTVYSVFHFLTPVGGGSLFSKRRFALRLTEFRTEH